MTQPGPPARTAVSLGRLPLLVVAISFFLPTLRGCHGAYVPANEFMETYGAISILCTAHVVGIALLMVTSFALLRREAPSRRLWNTGFAITSLGGVGPLVLLCATLGQLDRPAREPWVGWLAPMAIGTAIAGIGLLRDAHRRRGWQGWALLLTAFTAFAIGAPLTGMLLVEATTPSRVLVGGWVYLAGITLLLPFAAFSAWTSRFRTPVHEPPVWYGPFR